MRGREYVEGKRVGEGERGEREEREARRWS